MDPETNLPADPAQKFELVPQAASAASAAPAPEPAEVLYIIREWKPLYFRSVAGRTTHLHWTASPVNLSEDAAIWVLSEFSELEALAFLGLREMFRQVAAEGVRKDWGRLILSTGRPHTAETIAKKIGASAGTVAAGLEVWSSPETRWLEKWHRAGPGGPFEPPVEEGGGYVAGCDGGKSVAGEEYYQPPLLDSLGEGEGREFFKEYLKGKKGGDGRDG